MSSTQQASVEQCSYYEAEVGKKIKSSKKRYLWQYNLDGNKYVVECFCSKMSNKKKVVCNQQVVFPSKPVVNLFSFSFKADNHTVSILQVGNSYEVRINNVPFTYYMELNKNKQHFTSVCPTSTSFQSAKSENPVKKVAFGAINIESSKPKENNPMFAFKIKTTDEKRGSCNSLPDIKNDLVKNYYSHVAKGTSVNLLELPNDEPKKSESPKAEASVSVMDRLTDIFGSSSSTISSTEVEETNNSQPNIDFTHVLITESKIPQKQEEFKPSFEKLEFEAKFNHCMTSLTAPKIVQNPMTINNLDFLMTNPTNTNMTMNYNSCNTMQFSNPTPAVNFFDDSQKQTQMKVEEPIIPTKSTNDNDTKGFYPSFNDINLSQMITHPATVVINTQPVIQTYQSHNQNIFDLLG